MFEDSLMESQNRLSSPNQRWTTALSLSLQCSLAAGIIALPLLHPEALPFHVDASKISLPMLPAPPPAPRIETVRTASTSASAPTLGHPFNGPRTIPESLPDLSDAPPTSTPGGTGMGDPNGLASVLANATTNGPSIRVASVRPAPKGPLHISTGVSTGLLLAPIVPIYPRIAVAAHVEGIVKIEALISKSGHVEGAHVVSGPEMLRQSALEAIRNARYTPYLLNGLPTEVETTITVNFKLAS